MLLTLTLTGPGRLMGAFPVRTLQSGSLTIGRSPLCDWIIPDPERIVSGQHCRIGVEADRFILTDFSTNGVFVDGSSEPIGPGASVELRNGMRLLLGDANVGVAIQTDEVLLSPRVTSPITAAPEVPVADAASTPAAPVIEDDWFRPSASIDPSWEDDLLRSMPGAAEDTEEGDSPLDVGISPTERAEDLLKEVEETLRELAPEACRVFRARLAMILDGSSEDRP